MRECEQDGMLQSGYSPEQKVCVRKGGILPHVCPWPPTSPALEALLPSNSVEGLCSEVQDAEAERHDLLFPKTCSDPNLPTHLTSPATPSLSPASSLHQSD